MSVLGKQCTDPDLRQFLHRLVGNTSQTQKSHKCELRVFTLFYIHHSFDIGIFSETIPGQNLEVLLPVPGEQNEILYDVQ